MRGQPVSKIASGMLSPTGNGGKRHFLDAFKKGLGRLSKRLRPCAQPACKRCRGFAHRQDTAAFKIVPELPYGVSRRHDDRGKFTQIRRFANGNDVHDRRDNGRNALPQPPFAIGQKAP